MVYLSNITVCTFFFFFFFFFLYFFYAGSLQFHVTQRIAVRRYIGALHICIIDERLATIPYAHWSS